MCIQPGLNATDAEFRDTLPGSAAKKLRGELCRNRTEECRCNKSETEEVKGEEVDESEGGSESESSEERDSEEMESIEEEVVEGVVNMEESRGGLQEKGRREEETMKTDADVLDGERVPAETTKGKRDREEITDRESSKERG
ncbi:unnamed protein product [Pleuronectes platessa]|uniref:Uncharacterized protein n=1 Tax=Pleuronectes platessa TaxID=8262 RepID=A0A9N7V8T9_PLEPL|nr:unnamed protein product [Pleuronectes platessa]